jgi:hypothetical protein
MLHFAQYGKIRECVFVIRIYSSGVEIYVLFSLYSTHRKSIQSHSYELENRTLCLVKKCCVKRPKFFCVRTRFISEAIYSLYPTCFLVLNSYIIQSNNIITETFWFPAALLLAFHRGPNKEHLMEMWNLLTLSFCLTDKKICPYFKEHFIYIFMDVIKKSRYSTCSNERSKAFWVWYPVS